MIAKLTLEPEQNGRPLGVCINDCEVDYGQPYADLSRTCFQLGCAFAVMRWGDGQPALLTGLTRIERSSQSVSQPMVST